MTRWQELDDSGQSDGDVQDLLEATFLYALRRLQQCEPVELQGTWLMFYRYWRERLPQEAYAYLHRTCLMLSKQHKQAMTNGVPVQRRLTSDPFSNQMSTTYHVVFPRN